MERSPSGRLHLALITLNLFTCDADGKTPMELHWCQNKTKENGLVKWKDPESGLWKGPDPLLTFGRGYACIFPENLSKPVWIPARKIKLHQESSQTEDLAPGAITCSCKQSTTSATESSDSKQSTEDEEQEEDKPDNQQPRDHLGHGKMKYGNN